VRQYRANAVADAVKAGPAADAVNQALPILVGDIFGKNKRAWKYAITVTVGRASAPVKLEMTSVTQSATVGGLPARLVPPKRLTVASAAEPLVAPAQLRDSEERDESDESDESDDGGGQDRGRPEHGRQGRLAPFNVMAAWLATISTHDAATVVTTSTTQST